MTTNKPVERDWPKDLWAPCRENRHAFTWASNSTDPEPLDKTLRCDCGTVTWEEVHEQR